MTSFDIQRGRLRVAGLLAAMSLWPVDAAVSQEAPPSSEAAPKAAEVNVSTGGSPIVGAYYYPWYREGGPNSDWKKTLRQHLVPPQAPRAGLYRSDDAAVIKEHIAQSRRAGISFWAVSWWGPGDPADRSLRDAILPHPDAKDFRFAILYESTGRLGKLDDPNYDNWLRDLDYLEKYYFREPNYLRIDGRPVLFVYLTRDYFRDRGEQALREARERVKDLYLVGDDVFGPEYRSQWAQRFDAVTAYDVYGQSAGVDGTTRKAVATLAKNYAAARRAANEVGTAFIPTVAPGYNDSGVRPGHPPMPRYFADERDSREGDVFRSQIEGAALPNLDARCGRMMMVTSFNEWYEDTQIEATAGAAQPTTFDNSSSRRRFTSGKRYEDYGDLYLDILRQSVAGAKRLRD